MTAMTATRMLPDGTSADINTLVAWLISRIKRRRSSRARLSDATLNDLGITRELAEFGLRQ